MAVPLVTSTTPPLHKMFTLKPTRLALVCHQTLGGEDLAVRASTNRHSLLSMLHVSVSGLEAFLRSINPTARQANRMASNIVKECVRLQCGLHLHGKMAADPSRSLRATPQARVLYASSRRRLRCSRPALQVSRLPKLCLSLTCKIALLHSMVACDRLQP